MNFLIDENVSRAVVMALRSGGHDVLTVSESGLAGKPDSDVFLHAENERRIIVTRDHHFTNPSRFRIRKSGVLFIRTGNISSNDEAVLVADTVRKLGDKLFRTVTSASKTCVTQRSERN